MQAFQGRAVEGANAYSTDRARALQVIDRRQKQVMGDHPAADDTDINGFHWSCPSVEFVNQSLINKSWPVVNIIQKSAAGGNPNT